MECGTRLPAAAKFCSECGHARPAGKVEASDGSADTALAVESSTAVTEAAATAETKVDKARAVGGPSGNQRRGWYSDPWDAERQRWWDGSKWTGHLKGQSGENVPDLDNAWRAAGRAAGEGVAQGPKPAPATRNLGVVFSILAVTALAAIGLVLHVENDHRFQDCKNGKGIVNAATYGGGSFLQCKHGFP